MSIKIGSISAKDIYIGSTPAKEIRLGSTLIWSRESEEVYYTLILNGVESEGIKSYNVRINGEHQPIQTTYQILQGSYVEVFINPDRDNYYYEFNSTIGSESNAANGWIMDKDVIITITTKKYYTLTLNLDGDYEAFSRDGYTIYVDGSEFDRTSINSTYSITEGANVSTYNNSADMSGYEYVESITPTPSYNEDGSWTMDRDYVLTVTATSISAYSLELNLREGIDYTNIYYRVPGSQEWIFADKTYYLDNLPFGTEYYIYASAMSGYELAAMNLGSIDQPLILTNDTVLDIVANSVAQGYILTIESAPKDITGMSVFVNDVEVYISDSGKVNNVTIEHDGSSSIHIGGRTIRTGTITDVTWSGSIIPSIDYGSVDFSVEWPSLQESGTLHLSIV